MEGSKADAPPAPSVEATSKAAGAAPSEPVPETEATTAEDAAPVRDPRYPLAVEYCPISTLPAELHEFLPPNQFEK